MPTSAAAGPENQSLAARPPGRVAFWLTWSTLTTLAFSSILVALMTHARSSDLLSYIPLIPAVSGYLLFIRRHAVSGTSRGSLIGAIALSGAAGIAGAGGIGLRLSLSLNDYLALMTLSYLSLILAGGFLFMGTAWMKSAAFPMAFVLFLVPPPDAMVHALETASVLGSADVSALLFTITGTPLVRDGTIFVLPGIVIEIAQECSGINSSWVLFIVSLVASNLFLTGPSRRLALVLFVFPLAIVRNSIRILTIGLLSVHIGPHMIDSYIHHRGGPIFFALSLVPLGALLWFLRRSER